MAEDLFAAAAEDRLTRQAPLAARLRPRTLDEVVGQEHLLGTGRPLRALIEADRLSSVILWGPPGTGKTSLSQLIANTTAKAFEQLSAVTATVKDVREVAARAQDRLGQRGQGTILFLDEVHRFNKAQQDALLPSVESGLLVLIGATTENPFFEVNPPLLSRSTLFRLEPLSPEACTVLAQRGLAAEGASIDDEALALLVERSNGDGRHVLTSLEVAVAIAHEHPDAARDESGRIVDELVRVRVDDASRNHHSVPPSRRVGLAHRLTPCSRTDQGEQQQQQQRRDTSALASLARGSRPRTRSPGLAPPFSTSSWRAHSQRPQLLSNTSTCALSALSES